MTDMIPLFKVGMEPGAETLVTHVLQSGYVAEGKYVQQLERDLRDLLGVPVWCTNSGTNAIWLALYLAGAGPGCPVVTTPMSCIASSLPIPHLDAQICWADVDPRTGVINVADALSKVEELYRDGAHSVVILTVDWGGRSCDYASMAHRVVIQDAAHNLYAGLHASHGDYICYSFQAIKHLTSGDGGALHVPAHQATRARLLRWFGMDRLVPGFRVAQDVPEIGYKFHMNDVAAAIALSNFSQAMYAIDKARENAKYYHLHIPDDAGVDLPQYDPDHCYWLFTVLTERRDAFIKHMADRGIEASPVHRRLDTLSGFKACGVPSSGLPGVDYFDTHQVNIPVGFWLSKDDRDRVVEGVLAWQP